MSQIKQTPGRNRNLEMRSGGSAGGAAVCACDSTIRVLQRVLQKQAICCQDCTHICCTCRKSVAMNSFRVLGCLLVYSFRLRRHGIRGHDPLAVHGAITIWRMCCRCKHTCVLQEQGICGHASACGVWCLGHLFLEHIA